MFDRVTIRATDLAASRRFYATVLHAAGIEPTVEDEWGDFGLAAATDAGPATRRLHIAFAVTSRDAVDAFWNAGTAAGYADDGPPGPRDYTPSYYGAFLLDPDGNSAEAVHRDGMRTDGNVDHLWIRVDDVAAAKAFYEARSRQAGFHLYTDTEERVSFVRDGAGGGTFSLVAGPPTEGLEMTFLGGAPKLES